MTNFTELKTIMTMMKYSKTLDVEMMIAVFLRMFSGKNIKSEASLALNLLAWKS